MFSHGFPRAMLGHLLITGLATAHTEGRGKSKRVKITEAGRAAIRRRLSG
jgi:hypothetical protein